MSAFDRDLARGPWRALPVPAFLADRRSGVRFQLAWAAGLALLLGLAAWLARRATGGRLLDAVGVQLVWRQALPQVLVGIGMAVVVARGGFDLSTAAVASLAGAVAARSGSAPLALLAALACGAANGALVALVRVPGWLVTGLTMFAVNALGVAQFGDAQRMFTAGDDLAWVLPGLSVAVPVAAALLAAGCQVAPQGGPSASRVRERLADAWPYCLTALLAGLAGLFSVARLRVATPEIDPGAGIELALVVVLGGTFLGSGRANVLGTVLAALGVAGLRNGLVVSSVASYMQALVKVPLVLLAVAVSASMHVLWERRGGAAPPPARDGEAAGGHAGGAGAAPARLFDRGLFRGPGRIVPVPIALSDRRAALRLELGWSAALLAAIGVLALALDVGTVGAFSGAVLSGLGHRLVPALLLVLGACAVVARGGFDWSAAALGSFAGYLAARDGNPALALLAALGVGLANGALVALVRVPGWLASAATLLVVQALRLALLLGTKAATLPAPTGLRWLLVGGVVVVAAAAAGAFAWLQWAPGRSPGRPARRWKERIDDGLPYLFSSVLACAAGIYLVQVIGSAAFQLTLGGETIPALIVAGCWLGAGRSNVIGAVLAMIALMALEYLLARAALPTVLAAVAAAAIAGLAASRIVYPWSGRRGARGTPREDMASREVG